MQKHLAFGAILQDGNPIRLTGQDVQRGTFAHRHLVLHDEKQVKNLFRYIILAVQKHLLSLITVH